MILVSILRKMWGDHLIERKLLRWKGLLRAWQIRQQRALTLISHLLLSPCLLVSNTTRIAVSSSDEIPSWVFQGYSGKRSVTTTKPVNWLPLSSSEDEKVGNTALSQKVHKNYCEAEVKSIKKYMNRNAIIWSSILRYIKFKLNTFPPKQNGTWESLRRDRSAVTQSIRQWRRNQKCQKVFTDKRLVLEREKTAGY